MSSDSKTSILYSADGYELAVADSTALPSSARGLLLAGSDGANTKFILIDGSSRIVTVGAGTAGTPVGGVVSIQGVPGGTNVPISGTVSVSSGSIVVTQPTAANLNANVNVVSALPAGNNNIGDVDIANFGVVVSTNNSTTTPLGSGAEFTGTAESVTSY